MQKPELKEKSLIFSTTLKVIIYFCLSKDTLRILMKVSNLTRYPNKISNKSLVFWRHKELLLSDRKYIQCTSTKNKTWLSTFTLKNVVSFVIWRYTLANWGN